MLTLDPFSLALWLVCLSWVWDARCLRSAAHKRIKCAYFFKHQCETDDFWLTQDVSMTPNASSTGPREVKLKHLPKSSLILQSVRQSLHPPPTRAAHVNSRISIRGLDQCTRAHILHIHFAHNLQYLSHVRCLQFSFQKWENIVKLIHEIRYSQLYSEISCPRWKWRSGLVRAYWSLKEDNLYNNEGSEQQVWPVCWCFVSLDFIVDKMLLLWFFCTFHIIVIIL